MSRAEPCRSWRTNSLYDWEMLNQAWCPAISPPRIQGATQLHSGCVSCHRLAKIVCVQVPAPKEPHAVELFPLRSSRSKFLVLAETRCLFASGETIDNLKRGHRGEHASPLNCCSHHIRQRHTFNSSRIRPAALYRTVRFPNSVVSAAHIEALTATSIAVRFSSA